MTEIELTEQAQQHIREAIKFHAYSHDGETTRDAIKESIQDWRNQVITMPLSGRPCQYIDSPQFREMIKGNYRFIYEVRPGTGDSNTVLLLIFCHQRMDYQTIIANMSWRHRIE
ncbi:type II toxin-antitoxin system RelE/ParE family toxin [Pseudoalteromonas ruthenica]|uniref:type II toxin-antitoxin system RelE/ParE family toxin n=1 Tax=Pseudoalteromonas ruthenica TaxID=151081 RepID=UPI00110A4558|nr:hypothetical protein CWC06_09580 [Pseudoalteromonas ruthenica]